MSDNPYRIFVVKRVEYRSPCWFLEWEDGSPIACFYTRWGAEREAKRRLRYWRDRAAAKVNPPERIEVTL